MVADLGRGKGKRGSARLKLTSRHTASLNTRHARFSRTTFFSVGWSVCNAVPSKKECRSHAYVVSACNTVFVRNTKGQKKNVGRMRMLLGRDETERKRTELSGAIFVFIAEAETNTETLKTNMKADTSKNRHGTNTVRTRTKKRMIIGTKRL
jgi:hypothetical protein